MNMQIFTRFLSNADFHKVSMNMQIFTRFPKTCRFSHKVSVNLQITYKDSVNMQILTQLFRKHADTVTIAPLTCIFSQKGTINTHMQS